MSIIRAEVSVVEAMSFDSCVPFPVSVRLLLNKKGIKFVDDGKLSSVINENPIPLGKLEWYDDAATAIRHYKQTLPEVDTHA